MFARVHWSGYYPGAATLRALTVLWAVPPAIVAGAICAGQLGLVAATARLGSRPCIMGAAVCPEPRCQEVLFA